MSHPTSISVPKSVPAMTQYSEYTSTECLACWSLWLPFRACQVLKPGTSRPNTALGKMSYDIPTVTTDIHEDSRGESKESHIDFESSRAARWLSLSFNTFSPTFPSRPLSVANPSTTHNSTSTTRLLAIHPLCTRSRRRKRYLAPLLRASLCLPARPICAPPSQMHSFAFSFQIRATLLRLSRHAPNIEPLTRVKSNPKRPSSTHASLFPPWPSPLLHDVGGHHAQRF